MKTKFLSFILALTLLCSIMVPSAAFAAVDKGAEIIPSSFNLDGNTSGKVGGVSNKTWPGTDEKVASILVADGYTLTGTTSKYPRYQMTSEVAKADSPFTIEFEYYAVNGGNAAFTVGTTCVFIDLGSKVYVNAKGGYYADTSKGTDQVTAPANTLHKVVFTSDGKGDYKLYFDGDLLKAVNSSNAETKTTADPNGNFAIGLYGSGEYKGSDQVRLYINNVYAYASVWEPEGGSGTDTPVVPENKDVFCDFNDETIGNDKVAISLKDGVHKSYYAGALGGKSADDKAVVISTPDVNEVPATGDLRSNVEFATGDKAGFSDDVVTFEADVYSDNVSVAKHVIVGFTVLSDGKTVNGTHAIVNFNTDGTIASNGNTEKELMKYEANRWYKVAGTYTKADNKITVYVNGKQIASYVPFPTYDKTGVGHVFQVGIANERTQEGSTTIKESQYPSMVAVDNVRVYFEGYDSASDKVIAAVNEDSGYKLLNNTFYAKDMYGKKVSEVLAAISVPEGAKIYSDNTYATELSADDVIGYGNVMTAVSESGEVIEYYSFSQGEAGTITHEIVDGVVTAKVYTTIPNGDGYMFVLAKYKGEELLEINQGEIPFNADATATLNAEDGCTYKVFLWSDRLVPLKTTVEF